MAAEPRRIGLYGGSFDPVHQAHRVLAETALAQLALDELRWIPVGQPWQKNRRLAPAERRVEMVALAISDNPSFVLETCEVERPGPSYTLDTVKTLQQRQTAPAKWFLIIGQDQLAGFCTWHGWLELLSRVTLAVAGRAGVPAQAPAGLLDTGHRIVALDMPSMAVSSTALRQRLAAGELAVSLAPRMVAPTVARYIDCHGLYRTHPPTPSNFQS